ncbi:hypothetical protein RHSIM_Rhsim05G0197500 [Rhododendron simsii]|uniref:C2H2-type domain-containing protein n=1 Tax=Rhododendron simsii TaxID=118357 RepID=A0A834GX04_RHOSS|nr:hypothetical protein RHSIM_Rhsim05G0197500 [Rhododendron simsii]
MIVLKRSREQDGDVEALAMANGLMLLISRVGAAPVRVFTCKTCNRESPSFQALGGHQASPKKPRLTMADRDFLQSQTTPEKPKVHKCAIYLRAGVRNMAGGGGEGSIGNAGQRGKSS